MATPTTLPSTFVAGSVLTAAEMNALRGAFRILQVVSTTKVDQFSTSSTSMVDVTGVSVSITPTSTSSKVFVTVTGVTGISLNNQIVCFDLVRDSTAIAQSTGAGTSNQTTMHFPASAVTAIDFGIEYLDSPATTSATTYKLQMRATSGTAVVGRLGSATTFGAVTTITAMEVSA